MPAFGVALVRAMQLPPIEAVRAARLFARILTMSDADVEAWTGGTLDEFVEQYTDHGPTLGVFGFLLGLYFIIPFWQSPRRGAPLLSRDGVRQLALVSARRQHRHPQHVRATRRKIRRRGSKGTGVRRIDVKDGAVRGVELEDERSPRHHRRLHVEPTHDGPSPRRRAALPDAYVERVKNIKGSYIAVQAKIGLSKKLVNAGRSAVGSASRSTSSRSRIQDLRIMFDALTSGRVPPIVPFYCPVPTNFDEALAPPGCQLLTACAVAPTSDVKLDDPRTRGKRP